MTERPTTVTIATPQDEEELWQHLCLLYKENGLFSLSESKVRQHIQRATRARDGSLIGVIRHNGHIVASIGLFLSEYWYSQDIYLSEYWNYVVPEHRKSDYAKQLIDFAKWCNEQMNMLLLIGIVSTKRTEAKMRLYDRRLKMIGAFYVHGLGSTNGPLREEININW